RADKLPVAQMARPHRYSYPMRNVIRPSGSLRMFVMWIGSPPPLGDLLDGVVSGVNELFDGLGYGIDCKKRVGPARVVMPRDPPTPGGWSPPRQISSPSAGRSRSNPFRTRFSSSRYSLPSGRTSTL